MGKATITLFYDTRATKDKAGLLKLYVYFDRKQRMYTTGEKISPDEWEFLERTKGGLPGTVKNEERRELWQRAYGSFTDGAGKKQDGYLIRGKNIAERLGDDFAFDAFADALANYGKEPECEADKTDLIQAMLDMGMVMLKADRLGHAEQFKYAAQSLLRFVDSFTDEERKEFLNIPIPARKASHPRLVATLEFKHLTPAFLTTYEQWMQHYGKAPQTKLKPPTGASLTTVGFYLNRVRVVVNNAIRDGILPATDYPFGKGRYVIPAGANVKKALPKETITQIKGYQPMPGTMEQRSHDLWLFSYFCNGANLADICRLTWANVDLKAGKLSFIRQKTARSKKQNQTPIVAHLRPETLAIIERWATTDRRANNYVFPFLTAEMTDHQKKQAVHQTVKMTNKWMGRIAEQLGIDADVNSYSARHSYATTLLKSKAPLAFISKSLGHTNLKTTESYLGSFDDEEAKEFLNAL